jgi:hypothetical protein
MTATQNRREFLKNSAAIGVGAWIAGPSLALAQRSANEQINIACIGVGGERFERHRSCREPRQPRGAVRH